MSKNHLKFQTAIFLICLTTIISIPAYGVTVEDRLAILEKNMADMQKAYEQQIDSLKSEISKLREQSNMTDNSANSEEQELADLKKQAQQLTASKESQTPPEKREFEAGNLGLQSENPEISVVGDFLWKLQSIDKQRNNSDALFRILGVHYESYLDPYTKFKGTAPVLENDSMLGEAYITRFGAGKNLNITLGRFRQQFGVINRWHQAGLDFAEFPLAMRRVLGDGGLNQNGVSFDWQLGNAGKETQELTLQLTEASNPRLFGANTKGLPAVMAHFKSFRDIDVNRYREIGITAMAGANDNWNVNQAGKVVQFDETRPTYAFGLDYTYLWEPADNMRYRNFLWRTELYGTRKEILRPDNGKKDALTAFGGYTNLQWKLNREFETGIRLDYFQPDSKDYAVSGNLNLAPLALAGDDPSEWQVCPYITWYQSPWVHYRLEFDYRAGHNFGPDEKRLILQCVWAAGPHKHERY